MVLDKRWMEIEDRGKCEYLFGVDTFLNFAFSNPGVGDRIRCPCNKCWNAQFRLRVEVRTHLLRHGVNRYYTTWDMHGEISVDTERQQDSGEEVVEPPNEDEIDHDDMFAMLQEACGITSSQLGEQVNNHNEESVPEEPNAEAARFYRLLRDAQQTLYPGCEKFSRLSFMVKLLHLKCLNRWTDTSFDSLLQLLKDAFPEGETLPASYREARKLISDLGLDYVKIDVCKNDCLLYWGKYANAQECPNCHLSRWKSKKSSSKVKNIPHKVLRYFPLKSRLQRLYMCSKTASDMRWHNEKRVDDGVMRHPADSPSWKLFDQQYKQFSGDPRSVRLGLASDGFQPFGNMSSQHSIWPVVLLPYNLPPWMCMKQPYFMLSLLIPGPKCPGMDMDVYLQPLVEELKELWEVGVETYDAHSKQNFRLYAAVLWTISDFPAYADLSGWSTKGHLACPCCHKDTSSLSLKGAQKVCYMSHRRWLSPSHRWRQNKASFDGKKETRCAPLPLMGDDVLKHFQKFKQAPFGKSTKRKYNALNTLYNWKKKSILFNLPYWKTLKVRHNLDVMHIEKNVCDNVLGTLMNIQGKTKDTLKGRFDLVNMGIRPQLHPLFEGDKVVMPTACYTLTTTEKALMCKFLMNLRSSDGYLSNISRCVNEKERKISSMKSHDCHVFIEQLLPLTIRGLLPREVCEPLVELSAFFRDLCSKSLKLEDLDLIEMKIPLILCKLEMIYPPSFFDVMVHLMVHLPGEAKHCGPVQYRWMYSVERYLRTLKSYVRNYAHPEGSIAAGYLADECLTFCSRYMEGIGTKFNKAPRNDDGGNLRLSSDKMKIFAPLGRFLGAQKQHVLSTEEFNRSHLYVLNNCEEVFPFINQHKEELAEENARNIGGRHTTLFPQWLNNRVVQMHAEGSVSDDFHNLVHYPFRLARRYNGYIVNGFRFHTLERQENRKSQNSGVMVRGDDNSPDKEYYGVLIDVYELQYPGGNQVVLFKCDWWDVRHKGSGYKIDEYGITSVNVNHSLATQEPFVLASQVEQVFYIEDPKDVNWLIVVKTQPRDLYNMPPYNVNDLTDDGDAYQQEEQENCGPALRPLDNDDHIAQLNRDDVVGENLPSDIGRQIEAMMTSTCQEDDFIDDNDIEAVTDLNEEDDDNESYISDD